MPSFSSHRSLYADAVLALLRPVARFCVRHALTLQDLINLSKHAFIEAGVETLTSQGETVNVSRLSVLTGVHRADTDRIYKNREKPSSDPKDVLGRAIIQWASDHRFLNEAGRPKVLSCDTPKSEFYRLVEKITTTIHPGTVLFELERNGLAKRTPKGLKMLGRVQSMRGDSKKAYQSAGRQIGALLDAIDENLLPEERPDNLHIMTEFDNIYKEDIPKIREFLVRQGRFFHRKIRRFLSKFDADTTPSKSKKNADAGGNVMVVSLGYSAPYQPKKAQ